MATVRNKAQYAPLDKKYAMPNRKLAASPFNTTVPLYTGEIVLDTTTGNMWYGTDLTNSGWTAASVSG